MTNKVLTYLIFLLVILKIAAIYYTDFGLYGDEAQYWLWSQSVDLGYYSKPPLLAWFLFGYISLFGDSFVSLKTFPIIVYFFISFAIYRLCISLSLSKSSSTLCAISFLVIPAASLSSFLVSTDLLLLLFWALSMMALLNTRDSGSTYGFFILGLLLGLSILAKYAAVYFFLSLFCLIIVDKRLLSIFKNNRVGVLVFFFSFLVVLAPNIWWNINNGWVTIYHTSDNANLQNLNLNFYEPLKFLGAQTVMLGPLLFFSSIFFLKYFNFDFENKFLLAFSLPIFLVVLVESALVRANANWAAPALISFFILLFRLVNNNNKNLIKINFLFNYFIALLLFCLVLVTSNNKIFDRLRGLGVFTKEVSRLISDKDLVVSDRIVFSNISYEMRNKPNKIFMPHKKNTTITNHFQMSAPLNSARENDFFLIGNLGDVSHLLKKHNTSLIKEFDVPFSSSKLKLYEVNFK